MKMIKKVPERINQPEGRGGLFGQPPPYHHGFPPNHFGMDLSYQDVYHHDMRDRDLMPPSRAGPFGQH